MFFGVPWVLLTPKHFASWTAFSLSLSADHPHRPSPHITMTPALFTPIKVGDIELKHRIALAPLTR